MNLQQLLPIGQLGQRIRKALVAGGLLACAQIAWWSVRDPAWDGWLDAYNWPQLFLYAPVLFFLGVAVWQSVCVIAEWLRRMAKRRNKEREPEVSQGDQNTLKFWLRDSLRVGALYVTTSVMGDIPMAVKYVAEVRGSRFHCWWSDAVGSCLILMLALSWTFERFQVSEQFR